MTVRAGHKIADAEQYLVLNLNTAPKALGLTIPEMLFEQQVPTPLGVPSHHSGHAEYGAIVEKQLSPRRLQHSSDF